MKSFKKFILNWLFGDTPPSVVERQTEVHHNHYLCQKGDTIPPDYVDGTRTARQSGSSLKAVKELEGVWK